jgi:hypothetical protein
MKDENDYHAPLAMLEGKHHRAQNWAVPYAAEATGSSTRGFCAQAQWWR